MGLVVEFPANAMPRRVHLSASESLHEGSATVLILPVVRIERHADDFTGGDTEQGSPSGRRRKRRARS